MMGGEDEEFRDPAKRDRLQLLDLPPLRGAVGLLQGVGGAGDGSRGHKL